MSGWSDEERVRIGVSSCLLGNAVRYDGGHKRHAFVTEMLDAFVQYVPVCPEVETGRGIPREAVRLVRRRDGIHMVGERSGSDHTRAMQSWARRRVSQLERLRLSGYILKKDSPSCGMERVRIYGAKGPPARVGRGLFADELISRLSSLPVEEEGRLQDMRLRENFVERVFAYRRLRSLLSGRWSLGRLVDFHTRHKLQLLAHSPEGYRALGRLVAQARSMERSALRERYEAGFMDTLRGLATPRRHTNVLEHVLGHLRESLGRDARAELHELIHEYRRGLVPLVVPLALIRHHLRTHSIPYLEGQVYLEPHPKELMLRNHV